MSALDMPNIPPQYTPVVIATSAQAEKENRGADRYFSSSDNEVYPA